MKFTDMLKTAIVESTIQDIEADESDIVINETTAPEEILRSNNIKIKLVTPTAFGTQFDLAKRYDEDEIIELLKDFKIKIKDKSIFIVD